ncbi:hypothetical protein CRG98_016994 [Punica granatum]|uniref:Uncharacterized protein n=1 Tax=Punica granatum TaxID=22663 RepID=A0A2I0K207_PUNGR|nr:hypothetical protein CRG98_016994 [Punica granatum]
MGKVEERAHEGKGRLTKEAIAAPISATTVHARIVNEHRGRRRSHLGGGGPIQSHYCPKSLSLRNQIERVLMLRIILIEQTHVGTRNWRDGASDLHFLSHQNEGARSRISPSFGAMGPPIYTFSLIKMRELDPEFPSLAITAQARSPAIRQRPHFGWWWPGS